MKRITILAALALTTALPVAGRAQDQTYKEKRTQITKDLGDAQKTLEQTRSDRLAASAKIENTIATVTAQRAQALSMSSEENALRQLDSILTVSQDNLAAQKDRFNLLGGAIKGRTGTQIVVLLRSDASAVDGVDVEVDGSAAGTHSYSGATSAALKAGAVDELFRSAALPTAHKVTARVRINGQVVSQQADVTAASGAVTYVQFAVRNGQVVVTTWTSRSTTPF